MGFRKKIKKKVCDYLLTKGVFTSKKVSDSKVNEILKLVQPKELTIKNIRIGGNNDGGYLVPDDLDGIKYCFSPGVGNISKFENELSKRKIKSFLADFSVNNRFDENPLIDFEKKFLGPITYQNHISMKDWMSSKIDYDNEHDLILQIDIEGDEYDVLQSIDITTLNKFRIILIEFHNLQYLFDDYYHHKISKIFKILSDNYFCSHIHPNNDVDFIIKTQDIIIPPVMEFSFLRKDRAKEIRNKNNFPSDLDQPNNPNKRDLILPNCWFE
jgi:hypothetical protein